MLYQTKTQNAGEFAYFVFCVPQARLFEAGVDVPVVNPMTFAVQTPLLNKQLIR